MTLLFHIICYIHFSLFLTIMMEKIQNFKIVCLFLQFSIFCWFFLKLSGTKSFTMKPEHSCYSFSFCKRTLSPSFNVFLVKSKTYVIVEQSNNFSIPFFSLWNCSIYLDNYFYRINNFVKQFVTTKLCFLFHDYIFKWLSNFFK